MSNLASWLRSRPDEELTEILRRRPDVVLPPPSDFGGMANRLSARVSLQRALEGFDAFTLQVLDAVRLCDPPRTRTAVEKLFGSAASDERIEAAIGELRDSAVVWGEDELHLVGQLDDAAGPYVAGLGHPAAACLAKHDEYEMRPILQSLGLLTIPQPDAATSVGALFADPARLSALIDSCGPEERTVLDQLAAGPPLGSVRDARTVVPASQATSPIRWLLAHALLVAVDFDTVELPREVGLALRGDAPLGPSQVDPPEVASRELSVETVDAAGGGQADAVLRLFTAVVDAYGAEPTRNLRSGGIGVRELRRIAKDLDVSEHVAAVLVEVAEASGLLGVEGNPDAEWMPTRDADGWLALPLEQRWRRVATGWLGMQRLPSLVGRRGERDRVVNALSPETYRSTASETRRRILRALARLPVGTAPDPGGLAELMAWHAPKHSGRWFAELVQAVLAEMELLGVTGRGALTSYGRLLLDGDDPAPLLEKHLPQPVDHVLVQADLTVVAPGPLESELAREIELVADVESSGGATVYRVTETTVRRALDAGRTADDLHRLFTERSRTPVPQALTYVIDDMARRHGSLRVGTAAAYLRCDDTSAITTALADRALESLRLRRIAPTVLLSPAPVEDVLMLLREHGYAPMRESADGAVVVGGPAVRRARASRQRAGPATPSSRQFTVEELRSVVERVRTADSAAHRARQATSVPGVTTATTLRTLQQAVREERAVWLGYVNAEGAASQRVVEPIAVRGGYVEGYDHLRDEVRVFAIHRVTSVALLGDDDAPTSR